MPALSLINRTYTFTVELQGEGDSPEEAWEDAVDSFAADPGEPLDYVCDDENSDRLYDDFHDDDTDTVDLDLEN